MNYSVIFHLLNLSEFFDIIHAFCKRFIKFFPRIVSKVHLIDF